LTDVPSLHLKAGVAHTHGTLLELTWKKI